MSADIFNVQQFTVALNTLDWMISEVEALPLAARLKLIPQARQNIHDHVNINDSIYDSRSGLAAYYRYAPRDMTKLCHQSKNDIYVDQPKVHESVYRRVADGVNSYAPLGVAANAVTVGAASGAQNSSFQLRPAKERVEKIKAAWRVVNLRRILYFLLLATTIGFLTLGLERWLAVSCSAEGQANTCLRMISAILPDNISGAVALIFPRCEVLIPALIILLALLTAKKYLWRRTITFARRAWIKPS